MRNIELLSPCGDFERLKLALKFGADAVYLAGEMFGMRTNPSNFNADELKEAVTLAHSLGKKVYLTCNTLPRNEEIEKLPDFLKYAQQIGIDAFIIADIGVMAMAKKYAPSVDIHMSTQVGIVNYQTANTLYEMGASRIVTARELSLDEIKTIRDKTPDDLEIEVFVHGAMCMSFSGRCILSDYMTHRDANRGDCAQPCRWKYHLVEETRPGQYFPINEEKNGTYIFNSRDLCMIEHIPELVKAGVSSLKIEGRAKSAYYTAVTTNAYRHAVDGFMTNGENYVLEPWIKEELDKISHREYNTGFYFGKEPGQVTGNGGYIRHYDVVAVCEKSIDDTTTEITQRNKFLVGDTLDVLPPSGIPFNVKCVSLTDEYGNSVDAAPHPMQKLTMKSDVKIPDGSVIRKKKI